MSRFPLRCMLVWTLLATSANVASSDPVEAGYRAFGQQQWQATYEYLVLPAGEGDPRAQYLLSRLYSDGLGVPADPVTALTLLTFAARGDHPQAQYRLGNHYHRGELMERDPAMAHHWWRLAAKQGVVEAQLRLAAAYALGLGTDRDRERAVTWYRRAAEQGSAEARAILSRNQLPALGETSSPPLGYSRAWDGWQTASTQRSGRVMASGDGTPPSWQRQVAAHSKVVESLRFADATPIAQDVVRDATRPGGGFSPVAGSDRQNDWILHQPAENFTLQLFSSDKRQSAERVVRELKSDLPLTIFPFDRFGYRWYGVLAGSFSRIEQARSASDRLLRENRLEKPWIRRFRSVRKSEQKPQQAAR